jgi:hypothetical protein
MRCVQLLLNWQVIHHCHTSQRHIFQASGVVNCLVGFYFGRNNYEVSGAFIGRFCFKSDACIFHSTVVEAVELSYIKQIRNQNETKGVIPLLYESYMELLRFGLFLMQQEAYIPRKLEMHSYAAKMTIFTVISSISNTPR